MQVRVKSLQGDEYYIQVQNDHTVSQLKASIREKADGLPTDRQKLVYKGRTMQDANLISDYNLEEDCKIHLIVQRGPESQPNKSADSSSEPASSSTAKELPKSSAPGSDQSSSSHYPMDVSSSSRTNDDMIRMLGQWGATAPWNAPSQRSSRDVSEVNRSRNDEDTKSSKSRTESRFAVILRERLAAHFPSSAIDRIIENLYQEIDADINSSSLDDLERLAKQKLNITND